jgi:prepilin-type N-terminal cleavage/methylation domain-containing protein
MNERISLERSRQKAFTLIELLVVIAVIGMLAGMILAVTYGVNTTKTKKLAYAELNQVAAAIESYKARYGTYPPDNTNSVHINPLYFELVGTIFTNDTSPGRGGWGYVTLDGSFFIPTNRVATVFHVAGFVNSSTSARGDDERPAPVNFLKELKLKQVSTNNGARVLACSVGWDGIGGSLNTVHSNCPWRYRSSNPTNNASTFDLWVDLFLQDNTNRINNWSKKPQVVFVP